MADDVKWIVEELREPVWGEAVRVVNDRLRTAALMIESLAAELEQVKQERDGLNILLVQVQAMLETRTHERDAAVQDLTNYCQHCWTCFFEPKDINEEPCKSCEDIRKPFVRKNWQWRGRI